MNKIGWGLVIGAMAGAVAAPATIVLMPCLGSFLLMPGVFLGVQCGIPNGELLTDAGSKNWPLLLSLCAVVNGLFAALLGGLIALLFEKRGRSRPG